MALIVFSCRVTGPFMMFEETAKEIFKTLGRSWRTQGAFAADELPGLLEKLNDAEKYELIRELLSPNLNAMFVTPKDIDESVKRLCYTISEGLNLAFAGGCLHAL